jgi:hypothetical protein
VTFPSTDRTTAGCANASDDLPCVGSIDPQPPVLELGQQIDSAVDREIATQPAAWLRRAVQGDHQHGATIDFPLVLQVELVLIELATGVAHRAHVDFTSTMTLMPGQLARRSTPIGSSLHVAPPASNAGVS